MRWFVSAAYGAIIHPRMANIKLTIEYDGSNFAGWQSQADQPTIQDEIERALKELLGAKTTLHGAGRTDAGVHALAQIANFNCESTIPPDKFAPALQGLLPPEILIKKSEQVSEDFNSRFDASSRLYRYRIGFQRSALMRLRRWEIPDENQLSLDKLNEAAALFSGKMDCSALCVPRSLQENNVCEITRSVWREVDGEYQYEIRANRFLHNMVRAIVGLSVRYGRSAMEGSPQENSKNDGLTLDRLRNILKSGTWTTDHLIAPPQGLYLVEVSY